MQFSGLGMDSYALDTGMKRLSVYRATRSIKRRDNSLYNALRSIYDDSIFVGEISQLWPELPLLANLRCGLWYSQNFYSTCYFKSTDGHTNNWSFNTSRLNLHVALLAGQRGGCMIVDSTRKGKRFPDSMSKTIPIWTCVLNRAIMNYRKRLGGSSTCKEKLNGSDTQADEYWDCSLRLPLWVSETEKALIEDQLESWTADMDNCGADIASLALTLRKPLRPLWISQKTVIWLNEVPEYDSWDFTPVILLTASSSDGHYQQQKMSEFSWNYIPGAGDDEESWARGLSPQLFWKHAYDIISSGPDSCNQKVADIVEKDRVFRAQRSDNAPQVTAKFSRVTGNNKKFPLDDFSYSVYPCLDDSEKISISSSCRENGVFWLDSTNVAVGSNRNDIEMDCVDSVLDCDTESFSPCPKEGEAYLHLPIVNSKFDRFSLVRNLPCAVEFAKVNLRQGKRLLICCKDGEDISVCVCLAILLSLFDDRGNYDEGKFLRERDVIHVSKEEMRRRLVYICKYAIHARPCRGNLKQVFHFLNNIGP